MKVIFNKDRFVTCITGINYSGDPDIEVTNPEIFGKVDMLNKPEFIWCGCFRYSIDDKGMVTKLSDDEIQTGQKDAFNSFQAGSRNNEYKSTTDGSFLKAFRELIQVQSIRSLLTSETQQLIANSELEVNKIKEKYPYKEK